MLLESAMKRLEEAAALDEPAGRLAGVVAAATRPRLVKNALSGTWLGGRGCRAPCRHLARWLGPGGHRAPCTRLARWVGPSDPVRVAGTVGRGWVCERLAKLLTGCSIPPGQVRRFIRRRPSVVVEFAGCSGRPGAVDWVAGGGRSGGRLLVGVFGAVGWRPAGHQGRGPAASRPHGPRDDGPGTAGPGSLGRWGRRGASGADDGPHTRPGAARSRGRRSRRRGPPGRPVGRR